MTRSCLCVFHFSQRFVEEEAGDGPAQHPDVLLGEVAVAERRGVRGEHSPASPRGAARTPAVWDLGQSAPRRD